jgi:hypothetical protein
MDPENLRPEERRQILRSQRELKVVLGLTYHPNGISLEEKVARIMRYQKNLKDLTARGLINFVAS